MGVKDGSDGAKLTAEPALDEKDSRELDRMRALAGGREASKRKTRRRWLPIACLAAVTLVFALV
jgi:hypothetical protein